MCVIIGKLKTLRVLMNFFIIRYWNLVQISIITQNFVFKSFVNPYITLYARLVMDIKQNSFICVYNYSE